MTAIRVNPALVPIAFSGTVSSGNVPMMIDARKYTVVSVHCAHRCVPYLYGNWWYVTACQWDMAVLANGTDISGTAYCLPVA